MKNTNQTIMHMNNYEHVIYQENEIYYLNGDNYIYFEEILLSD